MSNIFKITLLFLMFSNVCSAHQDFYVTKTFGKVTVRFHTGFHYEEKNNAFIIGQYCNLYLKQYTKNTQEVLLDFHHDYTEDFTPNYFINYGKGDWISFYSNGGYKNKAEFKKEGIVIKQFAREFDIQETLKLLEYSINFIETIKKQQKPIKFFLGFGRGVEINSIDTITTKQIIEGVFSENLKKIIATKILRTDNKNIVNYYACNNEFTIFKGETAIKTFKKIKHFFQISKNEVLVFPSKNQFFYIKYGEKSGKTIIQTNFLTGSWKDSFEPYELKKIDNQKVELTKYVWDEPIKYIYDCKENLLWVK
jgi:hypothetical protein